MVILDNGHGVNTSGKRSPKWPDGSQLFEFEYTRSIVHDIRIELSRWGVKSALLVPEVKDVSLIERVARVNNIYQNNPDSYLISVHCNAGPEVNVGTGWEVYTSPGETKSDKIATLFYNEAKKQLPGFSMRSDVADGDPDKEAMFYLLTKTLCPAILTENLFMTNEKDCKFLLSDEGRAAIVRLHVNAIMENEK